MSRFRRLVVLAVALAALLLLLPTGAFATPTELGLGSYHALLIGVQDYAEGSGIQDLQSPENDVRALSTVLEQHYGFEVTVLDSAHATRVGILDAMDELRGSLGQDDALLVYYAGHGIYDEAEQRGYWLPSDARASSRATWIPNDDLAAKMRALPARHVLLLSDACFSGALFRDLGQSAEAGVPEDLSEAQRLARDRSRWVITSGGDEPVVDQYREGMSVFAYFLKTELERSPDRYVVADSFFAGLREHVIDNARQTPRQGPFQGTGHEGGQLVLVNRDTGETGLEAEPPQQIEVRALAPEPGTLRVTVVEPGQLSLDGATVGTVSTPYGVLEIAGVAPGEHVLAVGVRTEKVMLRPGETVEVELQGGMDAALSRIPLILPEEATPGRIPLILTDELSNQDPYVPDWDRQEESGSSMDWVPIPGLDIEMSRSEVTVAQYRACVRSGACEAPSICVGGESNWDFPARDHQPVNCVTWHMASAYASWVGGRLPSGEEWEHAAAAGQGFIYAGSDELDEVAWCSGNSDGRTHEVCQKEPNGFGLCDLSGNVWEWTSECSSTKQCVLRGGAWHNIGHSLRIDQSAREDPRKPLPVIGIRVVRDSSQLNGVAPRPAEPSEVQQQEPTPVPLESESSSARTEESESELAVDWVPIPGLGIEVSRSEVTVAQYRQCVSDGGCLPPSLRRNCNWHLDDEQLPMNCVGAELGATYARWVEGRLPTQEEWKAAARAGKETLYAGSNDVDAVAWFRDNSEGRSHPVCEKQRNGYGLCDMSGNLWEWTSTLQGAEVVFLGGSWDHGLRYQQLDVTRWGDGEMHGDDMGFRVVRDIPE